MNHETNTFNHYPNERAKLRNSLSDLRFLAFKCCQKHGLPANLKTVFDTLEAAHIKGTVLPHCLILILAWRQIISNATPMDADEIFRTSWQFIHKTYDEIRW